MHANNSMLTQNVKQHCYFTFMKAFCHQENESAAHALFIEDEFVLSFFDSVNYKYYQRTCITCPQCFFSQSLLLFYLQTKVVTELLGANSGLPVQISGHTELTLIVR